MINLEFTEIISFEFGFCLHNQQGITTFVMSFLHEEEEYNTFASDIMKCCLMVKESQEKKLEDKNLFEEVVRISNFRCGAESTPYYELYFRFSIINEGKELWFNVLNEPTVEWGKLIIMSYRTENPLNIVYSLDDDRIINVKLA